MIILKVSSKSLNVFLLLFRHYSFRMLTIIMAMCALLAAVVEPGDSLSTNLQKLLQQAVFLMVCEDMAQLLQFSLFFSVDKNQLAVLPPEDLFVGNPVNAGNLSLNTMVIVKKKFYHSLVEGYAEICTAKKHYLSSA